MSWFCVLTPSSIGPVLLGERGSGYGSTSITLKPKIFEGICPERSCRDIFRRLGPGREIGSCRKMWDQVGRRDSTSRRSPTLLRPLKYQSFRTVTERHFIHRIWLGSVPQKS